MLTKSVRREERRKNESVARENSLEKVLYVYFFFLFLIFFLLTAGISQALANHSSTKNADVEKRCETFNGFDKVKWRCGYMVRTARWRFYEEVAVQKGPLLAVPSCCTSTSVAPFAGTLLPDPHHRSM
jgi:hypothetical protein